MNIESTSRLREKLDPRVAVDIVIFNSQGQILLGKRLVEAGFGSWGFPGGHLNEDETIKTCAQREITEELGNKVKVNVTEEILAVRENKIPPNKIHHLTVIMKGRYQEGEIVVNEPDRCESWDWFALDNLPDPLFSGVEETINNLKQGEVLVVSDGF